MRIAGKASRKVAPVIGIGAAGHCDFVAGINLWNPAQGQQQSKCGFEFGWVAVFFADEARFVMISDEGYQHFWMGIKVVMAKDLDERLHRRTMNDHLLQGVAERKIENGREAGVHAIELLASSFEECGDRRIGVGYFADVVELRIDLAHSLVPSTPELASGVRESVLAEAI